MPAAPEDLTIWKQSITPLLEGVNAKRARGIQKAFSGIGPETLTVTNTAKTEKAQAQLDLIQALIGLRLNLGTDVLLYNNTRPEISHRQALVVARSKALEPILRPEGIVHPSVLRQRNAQGEIISIGADVNAYRTTSEGIVQEHKYERSKPKFTEQMIQSALQQLLHEYCDPNPSQKRIVWDIGTHIVNGTNHQFGDQIEVISEPVDPELMRFYLQHAIDSGLFWASNLHFAALECLIDNGKIRSVAFLPKELQTKGVKCADLRVAPTPEVLQQALHSVITNAPIRYS